MIFGAFVCKWL